MFRVRFRGSSSKVFLSTLRRQLSISDVDLEWSHMKFNVITYIFAEHKNQRKIVKYGYSVSRVKRAWRVEKQHQSELQVALSNRLGQ